MKRVIGDITVYEGLSDLQNEELSRKDFLVDGLIPGAGFTVLAGKAKAGKSCLAIQIAAALTIGDRSVLGFSIPKKHSVLVIQADCQPEEWQSETTSICGPLPITTIFLPRHWLGTIREKIRMLVEEYNPEVLIFDALNSSASIHLDVNSKYGMMEAARLLERVAGKRPFIVLHHLNKDQNKAGLDRVGGHHTLVTMAAAVLMLDRGEDRRAVLHITGRFATPNEKVLLRQESETGRWRVDTEPVQAKGSGRAWVS